MITQAKASEIPPNLQEDLCAAWGEGGIRSYCYLEATWNNAMLMRQWALAATAYWLLTIQWQKTVNEVSQ